MTPGPHNSRCTLTVGFAQWKHDLPCPACGEPIAVGTIGVYAIAEDPGAPGIYVNSLAWHKECAAILAVQIQKLLARGARSN